MKTSIRSQLNLHRPEWYSRLRAVILLLPLLALMLNRAPSARAAAAPPDRMSYQGFLVDGSGNALAPTTPVNYPVVFRIYDDADAGNLIWAEQQVVTVDKGSFSVVLGEGAAVTSEPHDPLSGVFASSTGASRFMGMTVTVGANPLTLLPRLRLLPSPYAFLATQATRVVNSSTGVEVLSASGSNVNITGTVNATGGLNTTTGNFSGAVSASSFSGLGVVPIGAIVMWNGNTPPTGWALCNGQTVNGIKTPDLRDRFIVGAGAGYAVGNTGGAASVTLTVAQMPSHAHDYDDIYYSEAFGPFGNAGWAGSHSTDGDNGPYFTRRTTYGTGGNQPFENRPPYYALSYIMRVQ